MSAGRRPRPIVEHARPRLSIVHVLNRVRMRLLDIQVWDVAGTMTFYSVLSLFPGAVAVVSLMSLIGIQAETLQALSRLVVEIFPTLDPAPYLTAIEAASSTSGGLLGLLLGTLGSLVSASNGVAALHRALHRVYDTREGRPFLWFRTIVFGETVLIVSVVLLAIGMIIVGGEASQRIGEFIGIPIFAFHAWNLVKWPILLVILIIGVSLAYYLFPNVRLPRYRLMTLGSTLSVLTLFGAALLAGRLLAYATRFAEVLTVLNGLIAILLLLWLANIVIIGGAALDAEFLRARQIASGLDAWHAIVLDSHATHTLDFLAADAADAEQIGRAVAESVRSGDPLRHERTPWIVDARNPLAVNPPARHRVTSSPTTSASVDSTSSSADSAASSDSSASPAAHENPRSDPPGDSPA
ncbi:YhjD/YihY/BrkB family envelope integrity protein [Brachybacterium sp. J144]|uniref:YihY/virulence factor BrkB family protein n=1 Tax=unclassified Brachybacterium TaxID=2623841 RepID=UPI002E769D9B|nr:MULTISPECIES: YhjD/YihY/BrkB family envelope integrity protein [unclassified Brachybacterium]MEE1618942.1 YhjD/YihY/BrkB family envelope integrity protein [Brachybacterium sp. J153]MEE1651725.1 YhjD/YihY/BrkB family envelope integrity protein [Brachybacterium sp. J144]